jgi:hypothetical protein
MGNSSSAEIYPGIPVETADSILDKLPDESVENIANKLKVFYPLPTKENFVDLSDNIYRRASLGESMCLKYLHVVKSLSSFTEYFSGQHVTFKDIFLKYVIDNFDYLVRGIDKFGRLSDDMKINMAFFFGNLYTVDLVSSTLMNHWLTVLENNLDGGSSRIQHKILVTIKNKVISDLKVTQHDSSIDKLYKILVAKRIIYQPTTQVVAPQIQQSSSSHMAANQT